MGQEARCRVRFGAQVGEGKALLETTEIIFRGEFRVKIPLKSITDLVEDGDELRVEWPDGIAIFELGSKAVARWAGAIRNPRSLLEKLGVEEGASTAVLGVLDADFLEQLSARARVTSSLETANDFIFYEANEIDDLSRLAELKDGIKANGAIWVVSPKGKGSKVKDVDVMAAARAAGLVDTKVVSFSETSTALKLVIPKGQREAQRPNP